MVWFKVDDTLAFHAKVMAAGNPAMGLWVRAGAWCAQMLTDGRVPTHVARSLGTARQARSLVDAGLWETTPAGYVFHDWSADERQPTREQVENKREQWREKKRRQRRNAAGQFDSSPGDTPVDSTGTPPGSPTVPSRPGPSRPTNSSTRDTGTPRNARDDELPGTPDPYPEHEFQNTDAVLQAAGLSRDEAHAFRVDLKAGKAGSTDRVINALHRKGTLVARIAEFRREANLAAEASARPAPGKRTTSDRVRNGLEIAAAFAQADGTNVVAFPQLTEGA